MYVYFYPLIKNNMRSKMKFMTNIIALNEIESILENEKRKVEDDEQYIVSLLPREIKLFLTKVDVFKFSDRIATYYDLDSENELKKLLNIHSQVNIDEKILKLAIKDKEIIETVLTNEEKLQLKFVFLKKAKETIDFSSFNLFWSEKLYENMSRLTLETKIYKYFQVNNYTALRQKLNLSSSGTKKAKRKIFKEIMISFDLYKNLFSNEELTELMNNKYISEFKYLKKDYSKYEGMLKDYSMNTLNSDELSMIGKIKEVIDENKNPSDMFYINKTKNLNKIYFLKVKLHSILAPLKTTYLNEKKEKNKQSESPPPVKIKTKSKSIKEILQEKELKLKAIGSKTQEYTKEELQLLREINKRKATTNNSDTKNIDKNDKIIIEAYFNDFNSERSRFTLSTLKGINFNVSFFNGIIKF